MALSDSARAIGAVTKLISEHLVRRGFAVSVGKPEQAAASDTGPKLNIFLFETRFDTTMRNISLRDDQPAPIWLSLKYLLTAFDGGESSDTAEAHELLGRGISALHGMNFLRLDAGVAGDVRLALENNPEPLKITFDEAPADLLSKVMQGTDERYRVSVAFEARPVMIAPEEPPSLSQLVGVDYTQTPTAIIGGEGVGLAMLASLGPRIRTVEPAAFEPGDVITLRGEDLHLSGLECRLAGVELTVIGQKPDQLRVRVESQTPAGVAEGPIAAGTAISAGEHPLRVLQLMPNQRYRASDMLVGRLLPVVDSASFSGAGVLTIAGSLLGTSEDDLLVGLRRGGMIVKVFEVRPAGVALNPPVIPGAGQKSIEIRDLTVGLGAGDVLRPGQYEVVVSVNGQHARGGPTFTAL